MQEERFFVHASKIPSSYFDLLALYSIKDIKDVKNTTYFLIEKIQNVTLFLQATRVELTKMNHLHSCSLQAFNSNKFLSDVMYSLSYSGYGIDWFVIEESYETNKWLEKMGQMYGSV